MNTIQQQSKKSLNKLVFLLILLILFTCFTAGCQPTPKKTIVENKGDGELEIAIMQTPIPIKELQVIDKPPQEIRITDKRTNDVGTVTVDVDANVILPVDEKICVARIGKYYYTQQEIDRTINIFFGDNLTFYDPYVTSKAEIESIILGMQLNLTDDEALLNSDLAEAFEVTDLVELRKLLNEKIEQQKARLAEAPDKKPVITDLNIDEGFNVLVDYGHEYMGNGSGTGPSSRQPGIICYAFDDDIKSRRFLYPDTATRIDLNIDNPELVQSRKIAQDLIDNMGIQGVRMGNVYKSLDNVKGQPITPGDIKEVVASDREYYVFCFERLVGERTLDFTFYRNESSYDNPVSYEKMEVWVEDDKVVQFIWDSPAKIMEIINGNTELQIDYKQALDLAIKKLFVKYTYLFERKEAESVAAKISNIEFEMVRIRQKDTNSYIVVPAWKIYGEVHRVFTEEAKKSINTSTYPDTDEYLKAEDFTSLEYMPNIVTVNALDGSIIDMNKGY